MPNFILVMALSLLTYYLCMNSHIVHVCLHAAKIDGTRNEPKWGLPILGHLQNTSCHENKLKCYCIFELMRLLWVPMLLRLSFWISFTCCFCENGQWRQTTLYRDSRVYALVVDVHLNFNIPWVLSLTFPSITLPHEGAHWFIRRMTQHNWLLL